MCYTKSMTKKTGIYCFTNKVNGKKYIGQSIDLDRRRRKMDYKTSSMFYSALTKYGLDAFDYEILELCPVENLDEREIFWIQHYQTFPPSLGFGYNLVSGGGHQEFSEETRKKLSECRKGDKNWNFWNKGESHPLFGKKITDEHKKHISESKKNGFHPTRGKKLPKEWIENKRLGMMGKQNVLGHKFGGTSKYHGIHFRKDRGNWTISIKYKNESIYIGSSRNEETAARMYDDYVREHNLPHPLNFPED